MRIDILALTTNNSGLDARECILDACQLLVEMSVAQANPNFDSNQVHHRSDVTAYPSSGYIATEEFAFRNHVDCSTAMPSRIAYLPPHTCL